MSIKRCKETFIMPISDYSIQFDEGQYFELIPSDILRYIPKEPKFIDGHLGTYKVLKIETPRFEMPPYYINKFFEEG